MMSGSSAGPISLRPVRSARSRACPAVSTIVAPRTSTVAPSASTAATLAGFGFSGISTAQGTPYRRDAYAIDWAWLPVEYVTTPRPRSAIRASSVMPPRTLNAPVGCTFSCLTDTSAPTAASSTG